MESLVDFQYQSQLRKKLLAFGQNYLWAKNQNKHIDCILYNSFGNYHYDFPCLQNVKPILDEVGMSNIWLYQHPQNSSWLSKTILLKILASLSKLSNKVSCMLVVCIAFTTTTINLHHTLTSQNIDQEPLWRHTENSLLVQHFDNQQSRSNLNFFFVITSILTLFKSYHHEKKLILEIHLCIFQYGVGYKTQI